MRHFLVFLFLIAALSPTFCQINDKFHHPEFESAKKEAIASNKPLLVLFNGIQCDHPVKTYYLFKDSEKINSFLDKHYIFLNLRIDDQTPLSRKEQEPHEHYPRKTSTKGAQNRALIKSVFDKNSAPYYVILTGEGKVINAANFIDSEEMILFFLENGIKGFDAILRNGSMK